MNRRFITWATAMKSPHANVTERRNPTTPCCLALLLEG
jgi:hypothetical protein